MYMYIVYSIQYTHKYTYIKYNDSHDPNATSAD